MADMTDMTGEETPLCSDLCEHCTYVGCGDFICDETNDVTIVDWKPVSCPEKRRLQNEN